MGQAWINGEPFAGHFEISLSNRVDPLYGLVGDHAEPLPFKTGFEIERTITFKDPAVYEQMVAACTPPIVDVTVAFHTLRIRRRLARLDWLVRRRRGRRLLRVTQTIATITVHNVEFAAP